MHNFGFGYGKTEPGDLKATDLRGKESRAAGAKPSRKKLASSHIQHSKVFIIATGNRPGNSLAVQRSWVQHVRSPDKVLFACGGHCRTDERLDSVVIAPDLMRHPNQRGDYVQAQMRWPWAMQWLWHQIERTGKTSQQTNVSKPGAAEKAGEGEGFTMRFATQPFDWWIFADDDTFVNNGMLDKVLSRHDPNQHIVLEANLEDEGGPGIAVSRATAESFVKVFWTVCARSP